MVEAIFYFHEQQNFTDDGQILFAEYKTVRQLMLDLIHHALIWNEESELEQFPYYMTIVKNGEKLLPYQIGRLLRHLENRF